MSAKLPALFAMAILSAIVAPTVASADLVGKQRTDAPMTRSGDGDAQNTQRQEGELDSIWTDMGNAIGEGIFSKPLWQAGEKLVDQLRDGGDQRSLPPNAGAEQSGCSAGVKGDPSTNSTVLCVESGRAR